MATTVFTMHSPFLRTMQEIFEVGPSLGDAADADDLSDMFKPGSNIGGHAEHNDAHRFLRLNDAFDA